MKIMKNDVIKEINENLDKIFVINKLKDHFSKDAEFQRLIAKQIIILESLDASKDADKFKTMALGLTKAFEMPSKYKPPASLEDVMDEVQYVKIYIKNTFKEDLADIKNDTTSNATKTTSAAGPVGAGTPNTPYNGPQQQNARPPFFGGGYPPFGGVNPMNQATRPPPLFDINFYPFKTKPKQIPILRIIVAIVFILVAVAQLLVIIAQSVGKDLVINQLINKTTGEVTPQQYGGVGTQIIVNLIIMIFSCSFAYNTIKAQKHERNKYYLNTTSVFTTLAIILTVSLVTDLWFLKQFSVVVNKDAWENLNPLSVDKVNFMFAVSILSYSLIGLGILLTTFIHVLNPQIDEERVAQATQEWEEENRSGQSTGF